MLVADALVQRLSEWRIDRLFGYPGDGIDPLLGALARGDGPTFVQARHEEAAAFMATAHAKYTGRLACCVATHGPGAIHLLNGLYDAKLDKKPVLAIVGQQIRSALGSTYQQEIDVASLYKDVCGAYVQTMMEPAQLTLLIDRAARTAIATNAPTCVIVPHDVLSQEVAPPQRAHARMTTAVGIQLPRVLPSETALDEAAAVLDACERVAILVGQGARGAGTEVLDVADRLGAGIAAALLGKPVLDNSLPHHTGVMGHLGSTASDRLMSGCDGLLIVGSNEPYTEFLPQPGQARAVQIDISGGNIGTRYPTEVNVVGDARETLRLLAPRLRERDDGSWRAQVEESVREWHMILDRRALAPAKPLNPQLVFRELSPLLPDDALIAVDVGSVTYWYARYLRLRPGMDAHLSSTLASMGCAVPYGLAARLAMPERPLLILTGDGAMQMLGLAELVTLADRRGSLGDAPLMILVLHNHDLNEVTWEMRETEGDPRFWPSQRLPEFPYAEYAQLLGLHGIKIDAPDQVREALDEALKSGTPTLVEAVVDPAVPLMPPRVEPPQEQHVVQAFEHEGSSGSRARRHWSREMAQQQPSKDPAPPDPQRGAVHVHLAEPAPATPSSKPDAPA